MGILKINLNEPRTLKITSSGGDKSDLRGAQGTLHLQLVPPLILDIQPPPSSKDQVVWEGKSYSHEKGKPGFYRIEGSFIRPDASSKVRPQTKPLSP